MNLSSKLSTAIALLRRFRNPFQAAKALRGMCPQGPVKLTPRRGDPFLVARSTDAWMVRHVLEGGSMKTADCGLDTPCLDMDGLLLRQGTSDTFIYSEIMREQVYKEVIDTVCPDDLVLDLGAHIGMFTVSCARKGARVVSVEATRENHDMLQRNIRHGGFGTVQTLRAALWSVSGEERTMISYGEGFSGNFRLGTEGTGAGEDRVETISLPDLMERYGIRHCDLVKMDIEGSEFAVLFNTPPETLASIKRLVLEYHPDIQEERSLEQLKDLLVSFGFSIDFRPQDHRVGLIFAHRPGHEFRTTRERMNTG